MYMHKWNRARPHLVLSEATIEMSDEQQQKRLSLIDRYGERPNAIETSFVGSKVKLGLEIDERTNERT